MAASESIVSLLARYEELVQQGQTPRPEEICRNRPELVEEFTELVQRLQSKGSWGTGQADLETLDTLAPLPPFLAGPSRSASDARTQIPGYDILDVLGQGAMGVVFKARQIKASRLVALKMIRTGSLASPQEISRFRTEAEAAGRLQHQGIVQIYEVGEHQSQPFFSQELCLGTLHKRLSGTPVSVMDAAQTVEAIARAADYAHRHGVIHRDLKPANVLLAWKSNRVSSGDSTDSASFSDAALPELEPKIADFGLAKKLDEASAQTVSGEILGTPSYMAPEQALGRPAGPAADTYALGAMLYEMLTGRPPFRAANPMDTLRQVINEEPVPPTRLNQAVPRDLESITLKCLEKSSERRYENALALAEDLAAFQAGTPVKARPLGRLRRVWRWCRRRPVIATLTAALAIAIVGGLAATTALWLAAESSAAEARESDKQARRAVQLFQTLLSELEDRQGVVIAHEAARLGDSALQDPTHPGFRCRVHPISLFAKKSYLVEILNVHDGSVFRPVLRIEDPSGKEEKRGSDVGDGKPRFLYTPAVDGDFRLVVSAPVSGSYSLRVREFGNLEGDGQMLILNAGEVNYTGMLTKDDPSDTILTRSKQKVFRLRMTKGRAYNLSLGSKQFDPFLRVENNAGRLVAQDDDSGGDLLSRVRFVATENANFRIVVTSQDQVIGEFELKVVETP